MISIPTLVNCDVVTLAVCVCTESEWLHVQSILYTFEPLLSTAAAVDFDLRMCCVLKATKTLDSGYLGSRNDEERSEMRYVV